MGAVFDSCVSAWRPVQRSTRRKTGAWLAAISSAPVAVSTVMIVTYGRPNSWADTAIVTAPARAPPMAVAGIQAHAVLPAGPRRTSAWPVPTTTPAAARAAGAGVLDACGVV